MESTIAHCQEAARIAHAHDLRGIEAYAQSCLAQVSLLTGALRVGIAIGERAVASFETRGDLWWAGRTLAFLVPIANALGEWDRALAYGDRALTHATALDDQRLTIMALLRRASTLIQRGDPAQALTLCEEAVALQPGPFDQATVKAIRGHALVRSGRMPEGITLLEEVLAWLERGNLRYTHCQIAVWLGEACIAAGLRERARAVLEPALAAASDRGYRHLEGVAHRLLAEISDTAAGADDHLGQAVTLLADVDAQHELMKARTARASLSPPRVP